MEFCLLDLYTDITTRRSVPEEVTTSLLTALIVLTLCLSGAAAPGFAQQAAPQFKPGHQLPSPTAVATRTDQPVFIDARFDEESWSHAVPVTEFIQRDPHEGEPATERTEVRLLYDNRQIYLAVTCYDSNPSAIVANELRRDDDLEGDDTFEIVFDTFHDHRNGYRFRVNPLGTERDQYIANEGQIQNNNWDEKWDAKARITEDGWVAEIAIPFKAMRFAKGNGVEWGINFHRTIMRKNEDVFWSGYKRGYTFTKISGAGHLEGLSDIQGFRYRIKPYVTGGAFQAPASTGTSTSYRGKVGLEDGKYLLTPDLALDVTVKPDFAQADVDQAQVNLSRFSLFFPEKREFFQEGAATFQFGTGFGGNDLVLFHSRRIGLSDAREEIPIIAGLKLTGTQGPLEVGLLNMQTDHSGITPGQNFTVLRLKSNILARSAVGVMLTRNTGSTLGGSNRAMGVDSTFSFHRYLTIQALTAKTFTNGLDGHDWSARGRISWNSDHTEFSAQHLFIGENFRPELGFVSRLEPGWKGEQRTQASAAYKPRPEWRGIRQFNFSTSVNYLANQDGLLDTRAGNLGFTTTLESGDNFQVNYSRNFQRLLKPFRISGGGGTVPAGDFRWNTFSTQYTAFVGRRASGSIALDRGGYYDGTITTLDVSPYVKPTSKLSFSPSYQWNRISRQNTIFVTRRLNTQVNYSLSQKWLTRASVIVNSQDKSLTLNSRLNYIFRPGDDVFVVYSESRNYGDSSGLRNRAVIVKVTYSLDR